MKRYLIGTINGIEIYKPKKDSQEIEINGITKLLQLQMRPQTSRILTRQGLLSKITKDGIETIPYWECLVWIGSTASNDYATKRKITELIVDHFIEKPKLFLERKINMERYKSRVLFELSELFTDGMLSTDLFKTRMKEGYGLKLEEYVRDQTQVQLPFEKNSISN